jgi:hypothetical protein
MRIKKNSINHVFLNRNGEHITGYMIHRYMIHRYMIHLNKNKTK